MFVNTFIAILNALPNPNTTYIKMGDIYGGDPKIVTHEDIIVIQSTIDPPSIT